MMTQALHLVIPAKAGIPLVFRDRRQGSGTPAFAGASAKSEI
jgi:hypothetical protein